MLLKRKLREEPAVSEAICLLVAAAAAAVSQENQKFAKSESENEDENQSAGQRRQRKRKRLLGQKRQRPTGRPTAAGATAAD